MKLKEYLKTEKIKASDFAKELKIHKGSLANIISGKRTPRPQIMLRIFEITGGAVTPYDFLNIPKDYCKGELPKSKEDITYEEKLEKVQTFYRKYKKSVKQKNLIDIICNKNENISLQSVNDKLRGKNKFTDFEFAQLFNYYRALDAKNNNIDFSF